jgi:hypothetical protein
MTEMDLMSDYTFLEECTRYVKDRQRDKIKHFTRYNKRLPGPQFRIRGVARKHGITLRYLLANFTRNKNNTTRLDYKTNTIHWRVEWVFPNAGNLKFVDEQCNELEPMSALLTKYFDDTDPSKRQLEYYQARGIGNIRILLKAEGVKRSNNRFYELNLKTTLRDNLKGKTIVEYPVVYLVFPDSVPDGFDVIDSGGLCILSCCVQITYCSRFFRRRRGNRKSTISAITRRNVQRKTTRRAEAWR